MIGFMTREKLPDREMRLGMRQDLSKTEKNIDLVQSRFILSSHYYQRR